MSAAGIDWEQLPDAVVEAFSERLQLVEVLLDPLCRATVPSPHHGGSGGTDPSPCRSARGPVGNTFARASSPRSAFKGILYT